MCVPPNANERVLALPYAPWDDCAVFNHTAQTVLFAVNVALFSVLFVLFATEAREHWRIGMRPVHLLFFATQAFACAVIVMLFLCCLFFPWAAFALWAVVLFTCFWFGAVCCYTVLQIIGRALTDARNSKSTYDLVGGRNQALALAATMGLTGVAIVVSGVGAAATTGTLRIDFFRLGAAGMGLGVAETTLVMFLLSTAFRDMIQRNVASGNEAAVRLLFRLNAARKISLGMGLFFPAVWFLLAAVVPLYYFVLAGVAFGLAGWMVLSWMVFTSTAHRQRLFCCADVQPRRATVAGPRLDLDEGALHSAVRSALGHEARGPSPTRITTVDRT